MDNISANITEIPEDISANISEIPENISANISEPTVETGGATYEIDFDENGTTWAFYSKNFGNISKVELINIDSYTIDGNAPILPYAVELNTTYLIDIIKTAPGTASIKITIKQATYSELIEKIDFSTGDGHWTYLLGNNTDVATNRTLLKYDNDLFTRANYAGGGAWTVDPLGATITLPELPVNGWWSRVIYIKDNYMLVSGGNTTNKEKYFCKVSLSDVVTDLDGNIDQYSMFEGGSQNMYMTTQIYDYINNVIYFGTRLNSSVSVTGDVVHLNLNDFTFNDNIQFGASGRWTESRKVQFNPYTQTFVVVGTTHSIPPHREVYVYLYAYLTSYVLFSPINNKYYFPIINDRRRLGEFDHKGNFEYFEGITNGVNGQGRYSYDWENNHFVLHMRLFGTYRHQYRKYKVQSKAYDPVFEFAGELLPLDIMFARNYLHLSIYDSMEYLHLFDIDVDVTAETAEFGYLNLPIKCWSLYCNKIL